MEAQLCLEVKDILTNEGGVSYTASLTSMSDMSAAGPEQNPDQRRQYLDCHTSNAVASHSPHQAIHPVDMLLRLPHNDGMTFLENLVDCDESLERLDLIGKNGLPATQHTRQPSATTSFAVPATRMCTYTFMPAQKAADDLWSHV